MTIKFLSESTINRIAAGEVIERPASVVKELVENSIDAGADKIEITLEQSGKNLIIISDNGHGMSLQDLEIAVQRHTTSKLDEDDLLNINSFGFRGEALPSIASISKMLITSKAIDADKSYQIQLTGGKDKLLKPTLHNEGTKIEIRDLFFATPARLKFLRTDKTEFNACLDIIKKIALAHPQISIYLQHDGRNILNLRKTENKKERITDIVGADFIENSAYIDSNREEIKLTGYITIPTFNRATSEDQYLFINNRPVKDKILSSSLRASYQDYLARDRFPVAVLFLQINPQLVDVNVHPTKSEVRFHDPNLVRSLLISSIKEALASKSHKTSTTVASSAIGFFNLDSKPTFKAQQTFSNNSTYRPLITTAPLARDTISLQQEVVGVVESSYDEAIANHFLGCAKAQLHNTYVISQTEDSIIIVDQHAAHERLGYEKIKQGLEKNGIVKQRLLIPEIVELTDQRRGDILYSKKQELFNLGVSIEKFGEKTIIVSEIPALLGDIDVKQLILDLSDNLLEHSTHSNLIELIEKVTETYACHYSIRAGRKLSIHEMNDLLRQMEQTPFSGQCNHGRPTYIELKLKDIEKLFGRR